MKLSYKKLWKLLIDKDELNASTILITSIDR